MPKAIHTLTTSRRGLLYGSVAAALATATAALPALAATAHPDAELIRLCAEFDELTRQYYASFDLIADDAERDAANDLIHTRQEALTDRICELPCSTLEGAQARARSAQLWAPDITRGPHSELGECFIAALVADLIGEEA